MSILSEDHFHNEHAAIARLEAIVWPNGPTCPHCGGMDRVTKVGGETARPGLRRCGDCKKQFTCKVGTVFESSHVPVHKWFQAMHLMCSSKKGISAHQLHRTLKVTYKTAWFIAHRLREATRAPTWSPMGGAGQVVEADETYIGRLEGVPKARAGYQHKNTVMTLVERGGEARSFHMHPGTSIADVMPIVRTNVDKKSRMNTDEAAYYADLDKHAAAHDTVNHSEEEYVRYTNAKLFPTGTDYTIHTNTVEGYFSIFKRGMVGVYQHCSEKHLHRYLAEFDFRYTNRVRLGVNDEARTTKALRGIKGRRLMYRDSSGAGHSAPEGQE